MLKASSGEPSTSNLSNWHTVEPTAPSLQDTMKNGYQAQNFDAKHDTQEGANGVNLLRPPKHQLDLPQG